MTSSLLQSVTRVGCFPVSTSGVHSYDSHDTTSLSPFPILLPPTCAPPLLNGGLGVSFWENFGIKDACTCVLEHVTHTHQHSSTHLFDCIIGLMRLFFLETKS